MVEKKGRVRVLKKNTEIVNGTPVNLIISTANLDEYNKIEVEDEVGVVKLSVTDWRGIIASIFIGGTLLLIGLGELLDREIAPMGTLLALVGVVITFYFTAKFYEGKIND